MRIGVEGLRVEGSGIRVEVSGSSVYGVRFRVEGSPLARAHRGHRSISTSPAAIPLAISEPIF